MNYTVREIRREDIDRIRMRKSVFPEWRKYFLERMEEPETFDGFSVELESGELLGIGMVIMLPHAPKVGVACLYATDLFRKYPVLVVRLCRKCIATLVERNDLEYLTAYADKTDPLLPRWLRAFGFEFRPWPNDAPDSISRDLDLYIKRCANG